MSIFPSFSDIWYYNIVFRLLNDAEIAKSKRDFELKKAAYDVEVQTKVSQRKLTISKIFFFVSNIFTIFWAFLEVLHVNN